MLALIQKPGQVDKPLNKVSSTGFKRTRRYHSIKIMIPFNQNHDTIQSKSIINNINKSKKKLIKSKATPLSDF